MIYITDADVWAIASTGFRAVEESHTLKASLSSLSEVPFMAAGQKGSNQ